jgi:hypothetical protein
LWIGVGGPTYIPSFKYYLSLRCSNNATTVHHNIHGNTCIWRSEFFHIATITLHFSGANRNVEPVIQTSSTYAMPLNQVWMGSIFLALIVAACVSTTVNAACPDYAAYAQKPHGTKSSGSLGLPYMRPDPVCRTFSSPAVEKVIDDMKARLKDPDLARLFENTFPNTLDTTVKYYSSVCFRSYALLFLTCLTRLRIWLSL